MITGDWGNWGGAVKLSTDGTTGRIVLDLSEHWAPTLQEISQEHALFKDVKERWERTLLRASAAKSSSSEVNKASVLTSVAERIIQKKESLELYFWELDHENTGWITVTEWTNAIDAVLELPFAWRRFQGYLVLAENGKVKHAYTQTARTNHLARPGELRKVANTLLK